MATTTANQQLPIPQAGDDPDVPGDMSALALALEKKLVMVFTNTTDRSARVAAPIEGMFAFMKDTDTFVVYNGTSWVAAYPTPPAFTSGTSVPSNASGANGDVFFKV